MKKHYILFLLSIVSVAMKAQQDPYFSHFMYNKLFYNPAYAGTSQGIEGVLLHHQQWTGYENNAGPKTQVLGFNMPVGNHGIGINMVNDKLGFEKSFSTMISYNYRFTFGDHSLSVGPGIGFMQKSFDGDKFRPEVGGDQSIPDVKVSSIKPDYNFGVYYSIETFNKFYVGLSALHLSEEKFTYEPKPGATVSYNGRRHYYLMSGMQFDVNPDLAIRPNLLLKYDGATTQFDANIDLLYKQRLRGGFSYRTGDAASILVGYYITPALHLGYSYDATLTDIRKASNGTHEIVLNYLFKTKKKIKAPASYRIILSPRDLR